jgi:predicted ester cyclase
VSVESNKRVLEQGFAAWNAGHEAFSKWATEAAAPGIHVHVPVLTVTGVEGYVAYNNAIRDAFPDAQVTLQEMVAEGDTLIVLYTFSGTNTGMLLTRPITTGNSASFTTVDVYHFADGKIVDYWQIYDRLDLLEQLDSLAAAAHPTVL